MRRPPVLNSRCCRLVNDQPRMASGKTRPTPEIAEVAGDDPEQQAPGARERVALRGAVALAPAPGSRHLPARPTPRSSAAPPPGSRSVRGALNRVRSPLGPGCDIIEPCLGQYLRDVLDA
jgi:hypothetical protein